MINNRHFCGDSVNRTFFLSGTEALVRLGYCVHTKQRDCDSVMVPQERSGGLK